MTPSRISRFLNHKSPAIGRRGVGAGKQASGKRVSGTPSVRGGGSSSRVSHGTQRKTVPASPAPEPEQQSHQNPRMMGAQRSAEAAESTDKDQVKTNLIEKFGLKKKKKKA